MTRKNIIKPKRRPLNFKVNITNRISKVSNENSKKIKLEKVYQNYFNQF